MKTETFKVRVGEKCKIDNGGCGMTVEGPAVIVVLKEQGMLIEHKCQYKGCLETATTHATGGDEEGNEHVYLVCNKHARMMNGL